MRVERFILSNPFLVFFLVNFLSLRTSPTKSWEEKDPCGKHETFHCLFFKFLKYAYDPACPWAKLKSKWKQSQLFSVDCHPVRQDKPWGLLIPVFKSFWYAKWDLHAKGCSSKAAHLALINDRKM